jgi:hypothetical protein
MSPPDDQGDWGEYRRLILQELQRLHDGINEVKNQIMVLHASEIAGIKAEIAVLQIKSGVWGFVAGAVPSAVAIAYIFLSKP